MRSAWILALAGCTLWLVVQNALLALVLIGSIPGPAAAVASALVKAGALLVTRIWSPWAAMLALGFAVGLIVTGVTSRPPASEVRHG